MGIIRASRPVTPQSSGQLQHQRARARDADYYQREQIASPYEHNHGSYAPQAGESGYYTGTGYEDEDAGQTVYAGESAPVRAPQQTLYEMPANEALDAALHLASHATRLHRLEQAVGRLQQNVRSVRDAVVVEHHARIKSLAILAGATLAGLVVVGLLPFSLTDHLVTVKAEKALQALAANYQNSQPQAPLAQAQTQPPAAIAQAPQAQPAQPQAPAVNPPTVNPNAALGAQADASGSSDDFAMRMPPARTPSPQPAASATIPMPPSPPIAVAHVFTQFQNRVRARMAKRGEIPPASWQSAFDRDAKGELKGKLQIAAKFLKGEGVTRDQSFAIELIKEAASAGEKEAIMWLGYAYQAGNLGKVDVAQAIHWFEEGSKAGIAKANYELGRIYEGGADGAPDPETAIGWYERAARMGDIASAEAVARLNSPQLANQGSANSNSALLSAEPQQQPQQQMQPQLQSATQGVPQGMQQGLPRPGTPIQRGTPINVNSAPQASTAQVASAAPLANMMAGAVDDNIAANIPITPAAQAEGSTVSVSLEPSNDVRAAQRMLKALGYRIDRLDGLTGPQTTSAVRGYQQKKMLYPDGEVSPQLLENLMNDMRWGGQ